MAHGAYERFADNFVFLPDVLSHSWRERDPVILTRRYRRYVVTAVTVRKERLPIRAVDLFKVLVYPIIKSHDN